MSNRISFELRKFETLSAHCDIEDVGYGMVIYDDYDQDYICLFDNFEELKEDLRNHGNVSNVLKEYFPNWSEVWDENEGSFSGSVIDFFIELA